MSDIQSPFKKLTKDLRYPDLIVPEFEVQYRESDPALLKHHLKLHTHNTNEIYVYVEGDVAFVVEGHTYSIVPGSIIITKPYEYHHCIYTGSAVHRHYVIYINDPNEVFGDIFGNTSNHFVLQPDISERMMGYLRILLNESNTAYRNVGNILLFLDCISSAQTVNPIVNTSADVYAAVTYINEHFFEKVSVSDLAKMTGVSINTLGRHFKENISLSPIEYLKRKRISKACEYLNSGCNVTETCMMCGYSDCSAFIRHFREIIGVTPKAYSKSRQQTNK